MVPRLFKEPSLQRPLAIVWLQTSTHTSKYMSVRLDVRRQLPLAWQLIFGIASVYVSDLGGKKKYRKKVRGFCTLGILREEIVICIPVIITAESEIYSMKEPKEMPVLGRGTPHHHVL